ncbi:hypothetical protein ABZ371_27660 [Streptomyces sp. NPDC005899]|uniref:hypothetical protein n=1 Tax=Streptomyces sp. NPDC005899 TaxID=3155716 RepID=UPI0033CF8FFD
MSEVEPTTGSHAQDVIHAAQQPFVDGWQQSMWIGAAVMGVLLVYVAVRGPKNTTPVQAYEGTAPEAGTAQSVPPTDLAESWPTCARHSLDLRRNPALPISATAPAHAAVEEIRTSHLTRAFSRTSLLCS